MIGPLGADPQLFDDVPMLIAGYRVDPAVARTALPPELAPHPSGRVLLNMWELRDPQRITGFGGFGPVSVTYLAIEVAGHDGRSADGSTTAPGRYWVAHWIDNPSVREYARATGGVESAAGATRLTLGHGLVQTELALAGRTVIRMEATVGHEVVTTVSGHSNYFSEVRGDDGDVDLVG
jgi:hypothetical protein